MPFMKIKVSSVPRCIRNHWHYLRLASHIAYPFLFKRMKTLTTQCQTSRGTFHIFQWHQNIFLPMSHFVYPRCFVLFPYVQTNYNHLFSKLRKKNPFCSLMTTHGFLSTVVVETRNFSHEKMSYSLVNQLTLAKQHCFRHPVQPMKKHVSCYICNYYAGRNLKRQNE